MSVDYRNIGSAISAHLLNVLYALIELITFCLIKIYVARFVSAGETHIKTIFVRKSFYINKLGGLERSFMLPIRNEIFILQAWLMTSV